MKFPNLSLGAAALGGLLSVGLPPRASTAPQAALVPAQEPEPGDWIEKLGAEDLDVRERAFDALLDLGHEALPDLERAAREGKDREIRWNARLLAREIRGAGTLRRAPAAATPRPPLGDDFRLFERDGLFREFEGMRERMDELHRRLLDRFGAGRPGAERRGSSVRVESGPDGKVKVEVTESRDGEDETKTYAADSWEDFRKEHPEVVERYGLDASGGGFSFRVAPFGPGGGPGWSDPTPFLGSIAGPSADRLGVSVRAPTPEEAKEAGVDEGIGLEVESVEPGSLAEALKVRPRDILLAIGEKPIRGPATIAEFLRGTAPGKSVALEVFRKGEGKVSLSAEKRRPRKMREL